MTFRLDGCRLCRVHTPNSGITFLFPARRVKNGILFLVSLWVLPFVGVLAVLCSLFSFSLSLFLSLSSLFRPFSFFFSFFPFFLPSLSFFFSLSLSFLFLSPPRLFFVSSSCCFFFLASFFLLLFVFRLVSLSVSLAGFVCWLVLCLCWLKLLAACHLFVTSFFLFFAAPVSNVVAAL